MTDTILTIVGNLTADPDLKFLSNGTAVANFTIASTPRTFNKDTKQWEDGEALFIRCSVWREAAENVAESLSRGCRVVATGKLSARSYERDGAKRTSYELAVDEIGPSLRYSVAKPVKAAREKPKTEADPWGNAPAKDDWGNSDDAPPF